MHSRHTGPIQCAAFAIGDNLPTPHFTMKKFREGANRILHGRADYSRADRLEDRMRCKWQKIQSGKLPAETVATMLADPANKEWFAKFKTEQISVAGHPQVQSLTGYKADRAKESRECVSAAARPATE